MQASLFREQAVEHQKKGLQGEVLILPSSSHLVISMMILVWVCAVVAWMVSSQYARQETVSGWLEPPSGVIKVFAHAPTGKIKQVLVTEGQLVDEGQPLVMINGDKHLINGDSLELRLLDEYQQQQTLLKQQLDRADLILAMRKADVDKQIQASEADLQRLNDQLQTVAERQQLIEKRLSSYRTMRQKGHVSGSQLDDLRTQQLTIRSEHQALQREQINQRNRIEQLTTRVALLPQEHQNTVSGLRTRLSKIAQQTTRLQGQQAHIIRASRAGRIANLQAQVGIDVNTHLPLMSIVPEGTDIEARLLIPVRAAGFIEPGQSIEVRYDAFPYQKFGLYAGEVSSVSSSIMLPSEVQSTPIAVQEPVYLVRALLNQHSVQAYGQQLFLKPGMTLSADIQLSKRNLLEWILDPLFSLQGRI